MSIISKGVKFLTDSTYRKINLMNRGFYNSLSDEEFLKMRFKLLIGTELDLDAPRTFNEKLQWLKLYDRDPAYTALVDKYEVKKIVAKRIGEEYVIPTIGCWDDPTSIPFESLPNKFVLKCTHNSGTGTIICRDKHSFDRNAAIRELRRGLAEDYYAKVREWPYKDVPHRIICEQYLENDGSDDMPDYKFHCFNGEPRFILVCRNRFGKTGMTEDFFTVDWDHLPVKRPKHPNASEQIEKPPILEKMLEISGILSQGIPFVRVDLYRAGGRIYFGEMTFFPASGTTRFEPEKYDEIFGEMLDLRSVKEGLN